MAKKQIGLLGLSNTTLLLIGGGIALYFLTRKKTEPVQGIGAVKISKNKLNEAISYMFDNRDYSRDSDFEQLMYNRFLESYYERDDLLEYLKRLNRIKKGGQSPFVSDDIKIVKKDISKLENSIISYYNSYKESKEDY